LPITRIEWSSGAWNALPRRVPSRRTRILRRVVVALLIVACDRDHVNAQVVNPTIAEFVASADHDALLTGGTAALSRYDLEFYIAGAASPFQIASLGKPAPGAGRVIRVALTSVLTSLPSPGIVYEARVASVGPGGVSRSTPSNAFSFGTPCSFSISPTSHAGAPGGGTASAIVSAGSGCGWTAVSNASWIAIRAGGSGTGSGTVSYSVAANLTASNRTGTLRVAGQTLTVTQNACAFGVSPNTVSLSRGGGSGAVSLTATAGCPWTAASSAAWLTITSGSGGTGSATIAFAATATSSSRTATFTVGGRSVTVSQGAAPAAPANVHVITN
jgi:hypothetical protein